MNNAKSTNLRVIALISLCSLLFLSISSLLVSCSETSIQNSDDAIVFTDALGEEISIRKNPERVAALIGSFADIWMLSGGNICATASDAWNDFGLDLQDAVNIGGAHSPSLELLLSSNPEFVIASASTASNVNMKETLRAAGITVAYFDVDSFYDYLEMLDICTSITGRKDLYEANGLTLKAEIQSIIDEYSISEPMADNRSVLLLRISSGKIKAKGSEGTILGEMLKSIGCINIADSEKSLLENLSIEAVIEKNPHHIFAVAMGSDNEEAKEILDDIINENPAWQSLDAVKSGRVHVMDKKLFNLKPNARWGEAYRILYETLTEN